MIRVYAHCQQCKELLENPKFSASSLQPTGDITLIFHVWPCRTCLEEAKSNAYRFGLGVKKAEAKERKEKP